jgi:endoribonuclease LACTB2
MTGGGNRTYLVAAPGGDALLIDAGVGADGHLANLESTLDRLSSRLAMLFVTHAHADHISGAPAIHSRFPGVMPWKFPWPEEDARYAGFFWMPMMDGTGVQVAGEHFVVLHTPGHSPDHVAIWHKPTRTMFSGDLVALGTSVVIQASRGGNLKEYLDSLERLRRLKPARLLPAHGPDIDDPEAVLSGYIAHRLMRERQVLDALGAGRRTISAIAGSIYDDLSAALRPAAEENVRAHLEKLRDEGRVAAFEGQEFRLI